MKSKHTELRLVEWAWHKKQSPWRAYVLPLRSGKITHGMNVCSQPVGLTQEWSKQGPSFNRVHKECCLSISLYLWSYFFEDLLWPSVNLSPSRQLFSRTKHGKLSIFFLYRMLKNIYLLQYIEFARVVQKNKNIQWAANPRTKEIIQTTKKSFLPLWKIHACLGWLWRWQSGTMWRDNSECVTQATMLTTQYPPGSAMRA